LRTSRRRSRQLAEKKQNPDYLISRGWLNNIENGTYTPSACKQYTLGAIYNVALVEHLFRVRLQSQRLRARPGDVRALEDATGNAGVDADDTRVVPMKSDKAVQAGSYQSPCETGQDMGEVPIRLLQHLDLRNGVYGFVGLSERTMFPIIRPGSIVQIDQNQRKVVQGKWEDEDDRPIYFVELRGEFICSWCEMLDGDLNAVPHPKSKCKVRRFAYPREADIVGRVISVTMRLVEAEQ